MRLQEPARRFPGPGLVGVRSRGTAPLRPGDAVPMHTEFVLHPGLPASRLFTRRAHGPYRPNASARRQVWFTPKQPQSMKKLPLVLVSLAFALSGCAEKKLTLKEVRNPTRDTLGQMIVAEGYLSSSEEQDLLTGEKDRFTDLVDLAMFTEIPKEKRHAKRMEVGGRLSGKRVSVRGCLKVGPCGLAGRSTVYIEVQSIAEAAPPAE